jgi:hypothetical protein
LYYTAPQLKLKLKRQPVLEALNIAQLVLYIGGLSLMGQGLLFILAGAKRFTALGLDGGQNLPKQGCAAASSHSGLLHRVCAIHRGDVGKD